MLGAGMSAWAWVNVNPTGSANTPASVSYVKLTKKATAKHWQVDFFGSQYSEFRIYDLDLSSNEANVISGGPYAYSNNSNNYVYNSGGSKCFTGGFRGEIGFVYLGYEDANGWPVYYVSAIAMSTSTGNYIIYRGHLPVRSFESDGSTRSALVSNVKDERTPAMRAFKFDGATSNNEYESANGDQFLAEISSDTDGDWYWNNDDFIYFEAANNQTTTNNYCGINFWVTDFSHYYNGMLGPAEGAYEVIAPVLYQPNNYNIYWRIDNSSKVNSSIVGYSYSNTYGACPWNSYIGNWNPGNSLNVVCAFDEVIVETGKYGNIYMRVYRSGAQLYCTIGEPAEEEVAEAGTITVEAGENGQVKLDDGEWGTTFSDDYAADANVTISAKPDDGYYFSKWDDENTSNPRIVSVNGDATYTAVFERNKTIVHAFDWANLAEGGTDAEWGSGDGLYVYRLYFTDGGINYPSLELQLIYNKSNLQNYGSFTAPREGEYSILNNLTATFTEFQALGGTGNTSYMSCYRDANDSYKPFRNGTITISQGANGYPYIVVNTGQGNDTQQFFELTVGTPLVNHNVSITAPTNGTITVSYNDGSAQSFTSGSRDIEENTVLTITAEGITGYHRTGLTVNGVAFTSGDSHTLTADATIAATFAPNTNTAYTVKHYQQNVTLDGYTEVEGDRQNLTGTTAAPTAAVANTYTGFTAQEFSQGTIAADGSTVVSINYNRNLYTLTWDFAGGATATAEGDYTHGTVAYGTTIVAPANPTRSGYTFMGWTPAVAATMPAANTTYTATWAEGECVTLLDNENDTWYDNFKTNHDGKTVTALYSRTFTQGRWSTLCLPFDVNRGTMMSQKLNGSVYEFKYATGDANVGDNVMLYFAKANTMEAGKCYIVNANSNLAAKTSFTFSKVTINLTNDINDKDHPLNTVSAYNSLPETKTQGTIGLVGTLRKGTLKGETTGNTYMGLKDNKIWYPSTSAPGNVILAYRGLFRSTAPLGASRVRIVVEGETVTELEVVNGELKEAAEARKFVQDGILYIERDGVIYNAQGQKVGKVEN